MTRPVRPLVALLAVLLLALSPHASARVQNQPDNQRQNQPDDEDRLAIGVGWGFAGVMIAERWSPVRLYLSSGGRALSGVVEITHRQDAVQNASITLPFATTPGRTVPVEAVLALPASCDSVRVRVYDERGRRLAALEFTNDQNDPALRLPVIVKETGATMLAIGGASLARAARAVQQRPPGKEWGDPPGAGEWWPQITVWEPDPDALSPTPMAYDAIATVVVDARALPGLRPDVLLAIRRWLLSGGSMLVLADAAGDAWRMIVPEVGGETPIRLAPPARMRRPQEVRTVVKEAAEEVDARVITLNPRAQGLGWRTRWHARARADALLAEGPVGFGWLTVITTRPEHAPALVSDAQAAGVWRNALRPGMSRWLSFGEDRPWYVNWDVSGARAEHQGAITSVLDRTLDVPTPGAGVFVVLVLFIVLLAALVGPVDAVVLKRLRRRQLSWATALAYTLVASVLAAVVPLAMRSGRTVYTRASCIDVLAPQIGSRAERSGLSAIFAASSGRVGIVDPEPGSWWRSVSALSTYGQPYSGPTFHASQSARSTARGLARENIPDPARPGAMRVWTLRTTLDQGSATPPIVTIAPGDAPGEQRVRVLGFASDDARIKRVDVRLPASRRQRWAPASATMDDADLVVSFDASAEGADEPPAAWTPLKSSDESPHAWRYDPRGAYQPARYLDLPGAWRRTEAIDQYVVRGGCALILLELTRGAPDVSISRRADTKTFEVYRIVVPLSPDLYTEPPPDPVIVGDPEEEAP